jgi:hypothetical protein
LGVSRWLNRYGAAIALLVTASGFAAWPGLAAVPSTASGDRELHDEVVAGGPWHFKTVPCVDGIVDDVGPRLAHPGQRAFTAQDYQQSGVMVHVTLARPTAFLPATTRRDAGVVHYQGELDNDVMARERRGDRVQVCLMAFPTPSYDTATKRFICNPDRDTRGWTFRIYDYRRRVAFFGPDTEHACGGA